MKTVVKMKSALRKLVLRAIRTQMSVLHVNLLVWKWATRCQKSRFLPVKVIPIALQAWNAWLMTYLVALNRDWMIVIVQTAQKERKNVLHVTAVIRKKSPLTWQMRIALKG